LAFTNTLTAFKSPLSLYITFIVWISTRTAFTKTLASNLKTLTASTALSFVWTSTCTATTGLEIVVEVVKLLIEAVRVQKGALFVEAVKVLVLYRP
jgi:hypothetical protein